MSIKSKVVSLGCGGILCSTKFLLDGDIMFAFSNGCNSPI